MDSSKHLTQELIQKVDQSNWYKYTLECEHVVYSKIRIGCPKAWNEHFIRCPQCRNTILEWQAVTHMEAVSDEHVSNVRSGTAFIVPKRILRTDGTRKNGTRIPSGDPFPYSTKDREYD